MLGTWLVALIAVGLLVAARHMVTGELRVAEWLDDATFQGLLVLWFITPFAWSRSAAAAASAGLDSALTMIVSLVVLKVTVALTGIVSKIVWKIVDSIVPVEIPELVRGLFDVALAVGAQLTLFVAVLGFSWMKAREQARTAM